MAQLSSPCQGPYLELCTILSSEINSSTSIKMVTKGGRNVWCPRGRRLLFQKLTTIRSSPPWRPYPHVRIRRPAWGQGHRHRSHTARPHCQPAVWPLAGLQHRCPHRTHIKPTARRSNRPYGEILASKKITNTNKSNQGDSGWAAFPAQCSRCQAALARAP